MYVSRRRQLLSAFCCQGGHAGVMQLVSEHAWSFIGWARYRVCLYNIAMFAERLAHVCVRPGQDQM